MRGRAGDLRRRGERGARAAATGPWWRRWPWRRRRRGLFTAADTNKDGCADAATSCKGTFDKWFTDWDSGKTGALTQDQTCRRT